MNDLTAIVIFLACLLATFGLVRACGWLNPQSTQPSGPGPTTPPAAKEGRP